MRFWNWLTSDNDTARLVYHILPGMFLSYLCLTDKVLGIAFLILLVFYQFIEDWRIDDHSYKDVRGYKTGVFIGYVIMKLIQVLS